MFSIVATVLADHPILFLLRFILEVLLIYGSSFILRSEWRLLYNEYNKKADLIEKVGPLNAFQLNKTVILSFLY
jgi:hypothetical protein